MKALYKKETLPDPTSEKNTYDNFKLIGSLDFCCDKFKNYCKKFTGWSYEIGKFAIVDKITYEGHTTSSIDFCPFCGEKIVYENADNPKKSKTKK